MLKFYPFLHHYKLVTVALRWVNFICTWWINSIDYQHETRTIPQTLRYECLGLPYSFFRVALWKSTDIYRISFRIKLGFIRIT